MLPNYISKLFESGIKGQSLESSEVSRGSKYSTGKRDKFHILKYEQKHISCDPLILSHNFESLS